jgi:hypothetical protein
VVDGPPAAGKSTLAGELRAVLSRSRSVAALNGDHFRTFFISSAIVRRCWGRHGKDTARRPGRFEDEAATVCLGNPPRDSQPEPGARVAGSEPHEPLRDPIPVQLGDAGSIVRHTNRDSRIDAANAGRDDDGRRRARSPDTRVSPA